MEAKDERVVSLFPALRKPGYNGGDGGDMDNLSKRVEQLEKDTSQIRVDMATLTERSKHFATKEDLAKGLAEIEGRIEKKIDSINTRIIWTLLLPAILAVLAWFIKEAVLRI